MGRHDQLFKELLETFFGDFLRLVAPRVARRLALDQARFLPKEYFTHRPEGNRRELDLVARVPAREGEEPLEEPEALLVHVEVAARARGGMSRRLREYAMLVLLQIDPQGIARLPLEGDVPRAIDVQAVAPRADGGGDLVRAERPCARGVEGAAGREGALLPRPPPGSVPSPTRWPARKRWCS